MTKYAALILILASRIAFHPSHDDTSIVPFGIAVTNSSAASPANFISIDGSANESKVNLTWNIVGNETADMFEVEKSSDGKNFTMAAIVFGTDKADSDHYMFYEKAGKKKMLYRIKLINKNKEAIYSKIIEIDPGV